MYLKQRTCLNWKIFPKWQNVWLNCLNWLRLTKTTFSTHFKSAPHTRNMEFGYYFWFVYHQIYIKIIVVDFGPIEFLLHMPLNMKCNITIDYTIVLGCSRCQWINSIGFSKTKLMLLFYLQVFAKFSINFFLCSKIDWCWFLWALFLLLFLE